MHTLRLLPLALVLAFAAPSQNAITVPLRGRVIGPAGEPVLAARISVEDGRGGSLATSATDGDGMFFCPSIPIGWTRVRVDAEGKAAPVFPFRSAQHLNEPVTVQMFDAQALAGRVVGQDGTPVAGATVRLLRRDFSKLGGWAGAGTTDAQGAFRIPDAPVGPLSMRVAAPGHGLLLRELRLPVAEPLELVLPAGDVRPVAVRVLDPAKVGVEGLFLYVHEPSTPENLGRYTMLIKGVIGPDGRGDFFVGQDERFRAGVGDRAQFRVLPEMKEYPVGDKELELTFEATPAPTVLVKGRLLGERGRPLAGESVYCMSTRGGWQAYDVTGRDGSFAIDYPCEKEKHRKVILQIRDSAFILDRANSVVDGTAQGTTLDCYGLVLGEGAEVVLRARRGARLTGRALLEDGSPARFCHVEVVDGDETRRTLAEGMTGPQGEFDLVGVRPPKIGASLVILGGIGWQPGDPIEYEPGEHLGELEVRARRASSITGIVRDASGRPLSGVVVEGGTVEFTDVGWERFGSRREDPVTDRDGRYHLWVAPGTVALRVPGWLDAPAIANVDYEDDHRMDITVDR